MDPIEILQDALSIAQIDVDKTNDASIYGPGIVWVLPDGLDISQGGMDLQVFCAVAPRADIIGFSKRVWAAIYDLEGYTPLTMDFTYGEPPLPGRDLPDADSCEITVFSGRSLFDA